MTTSNTILKLKTEKIIVWNKFSNNIEMRNAIIKDIDQKLFELI